MACGVTFCPHVSTRKTTTNCKDKSAAIRIKKRIELELELDQRDPFAKWKRTSLKEHANDYLDYQLSIGTSNKQAEQVHSRIIRIIENADIRFCHELSVAKVTTTIDRLRMVPQSPNRKPETYPTLSLRTKNFYGKAIKQLIAWGVRERRFESDPLLHLPMRKVDTDIRHDRRALMNDEFNRLTNAAAQSEKTVEGMTGPDRAFLYKLARMTGLRRSEIASLYPASFQLTGSPQVVVEAAYSKHRERDIIPLHPDLVPLIQKRLSETTNGDPLFPFLEQRKTADMIQVDLSVAKIVYEDSEGRFADFHALRHSFITGLWQSGVSPEVVMALARHRSLQMTMRYTHVDRRDQIKAIQTMLSPLEENSQE